MIQYGMSQMMVKRLFYKKLNAVATCLLYSVALTHVSCSIMPYILKNQKLKSFCSADKGSLAPGGKYRSHSDFRHKPRLSNRGNENGIIWLLVINSCSPAARPPHVQKQRKLKTGLYRWYRKYFSLKMHVVSCFPARMSWILICDFLLVPQWRVFRRRRW